MCNSNNANVCKNCYYFCNGTIFRDAECFLKSIQVMDNDTCKDFANDEEVEACIAEAERRGEDHYSPNGPDCCPICKGYLSPIDGTCENCD